MRFSVHQALKTQVINPLSSATETMNKLGTEVKTGCARVQFLWIK
jgi:hypothetical protein